MNEFSGEPGSSSEKESSAIRIMTLTPDDWQVLRDLKIRSLDQEPVAFENPSEGKEKFAQRTEAEWRDMLAGRMSGGRPGELLNVFARDESNEQYIGMVSAIVPAEQHPEHKTATVQHMYVDSAGYRGKGAGKLLLQSLLQQLRERGDIQRVELQVVETQAAAIQLYRSFGFKEHGRIVGGAVRGEKAYDEIEMAMEFPKQETSGNT